MVREEAAVIDVGILNINSYAGIGLAALMEAHPTLRLRAVAGHGSAGQTLRALFPAWDGPDLPVLEALPPLDLVFSALPHVAAARAVAPLVRAGTRVIDLSADFRLHDPAVYAHWYGHEHTAPDLLPGAVYGLTETDRARIAAALARPGAAPQITFVPHVVPMTRGILATIYARPLETASAAALQGLSRDYYRRSPCVRISETAPSTKWTARTNLCVIHPTVDERSGRLIIVSCIDNLVKGAAGQAVKNANLMLGLREETGLPLRADWP